MKHLLFNMLLVYLLLGSAAAAFVVNPFPTLRAHAATGPTIISAEDGWPLSGTNGTATIPFQWNAGDTIVPAVHETGLNLLKPQSALGSSSATCTGSPQTVAFRTTEVGHVQAGGTPQATEHLDDLHLDPTLNLKGGDLS